MKHEIMDNYIREPILMHMKSIFMGYENSMIF